MAANTAFFYLPSYVLLVTFNLKRVRGTDAGRELRSAGKINL